MWPGLVLINVSERMIPQYLSDRRWTSMEKEWQIWKEKNFLTNSWRWHKKELLPVQSWADSRNSFYCMPNSLHLRLHYWWVRILPFNLDDVFEVINNAFRFHSRTYVRDLSRSLPLSLSRLVGAREKRGRRNEDNHSVFPHSMSRCHPVKASLLVHVRRCEWARWVLLTRILGGGCRVMREEAWLWII